jgi:prevent-host-death family protein
MVPITQRELRNDSARILRAVQAGESFIVTRNGTPVAELRPLGAKRFVPREVIVRAAAVAPLIDGANFRRDVDAIVDQSLDG